MLENTSGIVRMQLRYYSLRNYILSEDTLKPLLEKCVKFLLSQLAMGPT